MQYSVNTEKIVWRNIDGEAVILNMDTGAYYSLNKTGSLIWALLCEGKALEDIITHLSDTYEIPEKRARTDILSAIDDFKKESLVIPKESI